MANAGESGASRFYRSYNDATGDHLYTASWAEANSPGYRYEDIQPYVYIYLSQISETVPLYRSYSPSTGDHFYTVSWNEAHAAGYNYEGPAGYVRVW